MPPHDIPNSEPSSRKALEDEISRLRHELSLAHPRTVSTPPPPTPSLTTLHNLLLLADSALPLGTFAFSSGLESFLAHTGRTPSARGGGGTGRGSQATGSGSSSGSGSDVFSHFLHLSLLSQASTSLPAVLAAHARPHRLRDVDDALDAATPCAVARRASVAQGRALLGVWEKSFRGAMQAELHSLSSSSSSPGHDGRASAATNLNSSPPDPCAAPSHHHRLAALHALEGFARLQRAALPSSPISSSSSSSSSCPPHGHLAPLYGAVLCAAGITARDAAWVMLLGHARGVASAGVRAGVVGPYEAQRVVAGTGMVGRIEGLVGRAVGEWERRVKEGREVVEDEEGEDEWGDGELGLGAWMCQRVPAVDLWVGRHEVLYSRIFNS